jgi:RNA recognition motif-containing protein
MRRSKRKILFVGGIPSAMSEESIQRHFEQFGAVVRTKIMKDKKSKAAKGYAFVTMASHHHLAKIAVLDHVIDGRKVDCQVASKKGEKKKWQEELKKRRVFVTGFGPDVTSDELIEAFKKFGSVKNGFVIHDFVTKVSKKYGYLEFLSEADALKALNSEVFLKGKKIICQPYVGRHESKKNLVRPQHIHSQEAGLPHASVDDRYSPALQGFEVESESEDSQDSCDEADDAASDYSVPSLPAIGRPIPNLPPRRKSDKHRPTSQLLTLSQFMLQAEENYRFNRRRMPGRPNPPQRCQPQLVYSGTASLLRVTSQYGLDQSHPRHDYLSTHPDYRTQACRYLAPGEGHASPESQ